MFDDEAAAVIVRVVVPMSCVSASRLVSGDGNAVSG